MLLATGLVAGPCFGCSDPYVWRSRPSEPADRTDGGSSEPAGTSAFDAGPGCAAGPMRIHDVQGSGHTSPCAGLDVGPVMGVVTAVTRTGFVMQAPDPDDEVDTSEGLEVVAAAPPMLSAGDVVAVSGTVAELGRAPALTVTALTDAIVAVQATGRTLPAPVVIGEHGRRPPVDVIEPTGTAQGHLDAVAHGLDFYESLEGMRVAVEMPVAASGTASSGDIVVLADRGAGATHRTLRGGVYVTPDDWNPERILIDDARVTGAPLVSTGDRFDGTVVGILSYAAANYRLSNTERLPPVVHTEPPAETTTLVGSSDRLTIATLNTENLTRADTERLGAIAALISAELGGPDLLVLEEMQDDNGTAPGVLTAGANFAALVAAVATAGGPLYHWRELPPDEENADGGVTNGNIRVGFLFNPDRLDFTDRDRSNSALGAAVRETDSGPELHPNPSRLAPSDPAWAASRKPLVGEFLFQGKKLLVVGCHFRSKLGDDGLFGAMQPPRTPTEDQRHAQARLVARFVDRWRSADPEARVVVAGDLNDYDFSTTLDVLREAALTDLAELLPPEDRYTYVYQGNAQLLDHVLVSPSLVAGARADIVHVFADLPASTRASDHDPLVVRVEWRP